MTVLSLVMETKENATSYEVFSCNVNYIYICYTVSVSVSVVVVAVVVAEIWPGQEPHE